MTKKEFSKAIELAKTHTYVSANISLFDGFGWPDFKPVACTLNDLAGLIAWQCLCFNGSTCTEALNEIWACRKKFIVI